MVLILCQVGKTSKTSDRKKMRRETQKGRRDRVVERDERASRNEDGGAERDD